MASADRQQGERSTMPDSTIRSVSTCDARFPLPPGAGTDSVHTNSEYSFAVTLLTGEDGLRGTGIVLTLGEGNRLVCEAIELLARPLAGIAIEELMSDFGRVSRKLADDPSLRWLGPHKRLFRPLGQEPRHTIVEAAPRSHPRRSRSSSGPELSGRGFE